MTSFSRETLAPCHSPAHVSGCRSHGSGPVWRRASQVHNTKHRAAATVWQPCCLSVPSRRPAAAAASRQSTSTVFAYTCPPRSIVSVGWCRLSGNCGSFASAFLGPPPDAPLLCSIFAFAFFALLGLCLALNCHTLPSETSRTRTAAGVLAGEEPMDVDCPGKQQPALSSATTTITTHPSGLPFPGALVGGMHNVVHHEL